MNAVDLMIQAYRLEHDTQYEIVGTTNTTAADKIDDDIPANETWLGKILFVLNSKQRFMHNYELAELLKPYYKDKTFEKVKRRISSVLTHANGINNPEKLTNYRFSSSKQDTVWGFKEWLDNKGKIKDENMYYDKNKLSIKRYS